MFRTLFEGGSLMALPVLVLVAFVLVFVGVVVWVVVRGRASFDRVSRLPLAEDDGSVVVAASPHQAHGMADGCGSRGHCGGDQHHADKDGSEKRSCGRGRCGSEVQR